MLQGESDTYPCPEWYSLIQAAKYLGIPVPEIINVPRYWIDKALTALTAEAEAQEIINSRS